MPQREAAEPGACSAEGCERRPSRGLLCERHYRADLAKRRAPCSVEGCERPVYGHGLCEAHNRARRLYGDPTARMRHGPWEAWNWLLAHVDYDGDDCLIWPFSLSPDGYGQVGVPGNLVPQRASRVMCELAHGPAPSPEHDNALHAPQICHTPSCVSPKHLRWGTDKENHADRRLDGTQVEGERSPHALLTADQVREIRRLRREGMILRELAERFEVSLPTIHAIVSRRNWRHVQ